MKFIGITGGVGAGKSAILSYLQKKPKTKVVLADEIARMLMEPGTDCYYKIVDAFSNEDIYETAESEPAFDRTKLAQVIFSDREKRELLNAIVHPAVKEYVKTIYKDELGKGEMDFLFLEAALLIEEKYDEICDELWYIDTSEKNRRMRLKETRGYSDEKISQIFASQLSETEFRKFTSFSIDNNGSLEETYQQIEKRINTLC